jgi:hypothetical protein
LLLPTTAERKKRSFFYYNFFFACVSVFNHVEKAGLTLKPLHLFLIADTAFERQLVEG